MIEILVYLATTSKIFGEQAQLTLAGWDETLSRAAASDPRTPQEVLSYMVSPQNLRPILLPALLDNPSVSDASLSELAAAGPREVVDAMLSSTRIIHSAEILKALGSNPNLSGIQSAKIESEIEALTPKVSNPESETPASSGPPTGNPAEAPLETESSELNDMPEDGLLAYLSEHASEISEEADKLFQPIGGFYDEFVPGAEEDSAGEAASEPNSVPDASAETAPAAQIAPAAATAKRSHLGAGHERGSALQKISRLDVKGRIQLAMKGNKEERSLLIRDGTKVVALAVLESPKLSDSEVERFASQKNVLEAVLRGITMKRRFVKHYGIVRNLVFNPRTPLDVSLGLVKHLLTQDLRHLSGNKDVSDTVRKLATKMFKQKLSANKKSE